MPATQQDLLKTRNEINNLIQTQCQEMQKSTFEQIDRLFFTTKQELEGRVRASIEKNVMQLEELVTDLIEAKKEAAHGIYQHHITFNQLLNKKLQLHTLRIQKELRITLDTIKERLALEQTNALDRLRMLHNELHTLETENKRCTDQLLELVKQQYEMVLKKCTDDAQEHGQKISHEIEQTKQSITLQTDAIELVQSKIQDIKNHNRHKIENAVALFDRWKRIQDTLKKNKSP